MKKRFLSIGLMILFSIICLLSVANAEYKNEWRVESQRLVYYDNNGLKLSGQANVNGLDYTFSETGYVLGNGKVQKIIDSIKDEYFFIDENDYIYTGMKTIDGKTYYFDPSSDGKAYTSGVKNIDDEYYYFGRDGIMQTGFIHDDTNNLTYYAGSDGKLLTGWQTIDGATYFFSTDKDNYPCHALTGLQKIKSEEDEDESDTYYFSQDGKMQINQLITIVEEDEDENRLIYYFGEDGKAVSGWKTIDGNEYYFRPAACVDTEAELEKGGVSYVFEFDEYGRIISIDDEGIPEITDISQATVSIKDSVYNGKANEPKVNVILNGRPLDSKNYELFFADNKNVGKATVTITAKGIYTDKYIATFKILPKVVQSPTVIAGSKKLTVKWKYDKKNDYDGYEIECSLKKDFSSSKTITVKKAKKTSTVIKKLKKGKIYYVRIRTWKKVDGTKYYSAWSVKLKKKVK